MGSLEDRAEELAQYEDLSVLHSALFSAYEAELSSVGWPSNSQVILTTAFEELESLSRYIKDEND